MSSASGDDEMTSTARWWIPALVSLSASIANLAQAAPPIYQRGYDTNVSGANVAETVLNTSTVSPNTFGHLFDLPVDERVYAQPLYVPNVPIPNNGTRNVLYVATMNDTVYAFDADLGGPPLWTVNLASALNVTSVTWANFNIAPVSTPGDLGILSTPVIDPLTNVMYVVACTLENGTMAYRLHAIDITNGSEPYGAGVLIGGSYGGANFLASRQTQRVSLVLAKNQVVFAFGAMEAESTSTYSGWIMAYDKRTLQQSGIFATVTRASGGGGVWQSGRPPAVDSAGYVYVFVGNAWGGGYDGMNNFSESVLKLDPSQGLLLVDWFTPGNWSLLDKGDQDLTSSGPILLPNTTLLAGGGKTGDLYVLDTANLGKYVADDSQVVQKVRITSGGHIHGGPVYWSRSAGNGGPMIYNWGTDDALKSFPFLGSGISTSPSAMGMTTAVQPGGILTLSSNGEQHGSGLIWATTTTAKPAIGILHAFDAEDVSNELWNSMMSPTSDSYGAFAKFVPPVVANGKVFVATWTNKVAVYGLGIAPPAFSVAPKLLRFGDVQTTVASPAQSVVVTNNTSVALPIASITFWGQSAAQFSQTNNCGASIPAGSTCTVDVVFTPAAVGLQAAWLYVNGGKGLGTKATALTGSGVAPFTVTPSSLTFGRVQTNTGSTPQSVTVTNGGAAALPITGITLSGTSAGQYSQSNSCGTSIPLGSNCTISVVFTPTTAGAKTATLNISAGPGVTQATGLTGTGVVPLTVSPSSLAFGTQQTNTTSAAQVLTVTNGSSAPAAISGVTISGTYAGQFSQTNNCGVSVPAASSCTINVVFTPTSAGYVGATLKVNEPGLTINVNINGTGTVPFTMTPTSLSFGSVPENTPSVAQSVTVTNNGSSPLPISGITLSGVNPGQFSQTNTCGTPVAVGSTCLISVVFTPTAIASYTAKLVVAAPGVTQKTSLSGSGTAPP